MQFWIIFKSKIYHLATRNIGFNTCMSRWMEKLADKKISRREFLKDSAVATAAVAGLSLFGGQNVVKAEEEKAAEVSTEHTPITDPEEGGKWVGAACWHNCGGRCMNKVMVKDGMVIRQKTDDTHPDSYDYPQQRGCVRGKAQQQQCFGADRIKYPMKRKHWNPGEPNGELRGKDEWERISWDEALTYVADELKRVYAEYGPTAVICNGCAVARTLRAKALWEEAGIRARILEMPTVKPIDREAILAAAADCGRIVTVEEHNVIGGLGSAVCEVVCEAEKPCTVTRVGIDDIFTESGPHDQLLDKYNLSPEHNAEVVKSACGK